jgi:citrate lyase subunit beta/citryl-CoA lyase
MVLLFVPGDRPDRFEKAAGAADLAILDLEDAVAPDRKHVARAAVAQALASGARYAVRVNAVGTDAFAEDIAALEGAAAPAAVLIAKTASFADVEAVQMRLPNSTLYALIESITGIVELDAIAAVDGLGGLALGAYDLCAELRARPTAEVLAPWRARIVLAARRFGREVLDGPFADVRDDRGLAEDARRAADFGFSGKLAIHPSQVPVIRAAFAPNAAEIAQAREVVAAGSNGVSIVNGVMVDAPLVALAHQILERAGKGETSA